jgi:hypothetical protein
MTDKEKLLLALKSGLDLEEDFIVKLAPLCLGFLRSSQLAEKEKNEVEKILSVLENGSVRHKKTVESLIRKIETEERDGYQENTL